MKTNSKRGTASTSHSLTFRVQRYVVTATKPVQQLQIRPIVVHNYRTPHTIPPSYIRVPAVVWECGEGQTDKHTVTNIHFAWATLTWNVIICSLSNGATSSDHERPWSSPQLFLSVILNLSKSCILDNISRTMSQTWLSWTVVCCESKNKPL